MNELRKLIRRQIRGGPSDHSSVSSPVSTMTIRIEQLSSHEGPRWQAIRLRALADSPGAFSATFEEARTRTPEGWSTQVKELPTFVAMTDGLDVGVVRVARDHSATSTAWLISMWVAPQVRRTGVGAALVDTVVGWARESRIHRLLLEVADHNHPAIGLYSRKGFVPTGRTGTMPPPREHIREHERVLVLNCEQAPDPDSDYGFEFHES